MWVDVEATVAGGSRRCRHSSAGPPLPIDTGPHVLSPSPPSCTARLMSATQSESRAHTRFGNTGSRRLADLTTNSSQPAASTFTPFESLARHPIHLTAHSPAAPDHCNNPTAHSRRPWNFCNRVASIARRESRPRRMICIAT
jgi:hypothetical protein